MADWQFTFGKLDGQDIRNCNDVWQLKRAMNEEVGGRRRVYARRRLIELGELVRYDWVENVWNDEKYFEILPELEKKYPSKEGSYYGSNIPQFEFDVCRIPTKHKYATPRQVEVKEKMRFEKEKVGHFFTNGEKVTIEIKEIGSFSFDGSFGRTHIRTYLTSDGKVVKYMGGNPPDISTEEFIKVTATVKHDNYKGPETKLQRIKKCKIKQVEEVKI